tara:strand:- start:177 stop:347 length:171 start_codon:yes stop_codon:yes gene_type:complete
MKSNLRAMLEAKEGRVTQLHLLTINVEDAFLVEIRDLGIFINLLFVEGPGVGSFRL